jgi:hypothetical protein
MKMKTAARFDSLKTPDIASGMALSAQLAQDISHSLGTAQPFMPRRGGMNSLAPAPISQEMIASILLVAVSIANDGWAK